MTHRWTKSRLLAPALAAVLAPTAPVIAQAADVHKADCQVHAVLASKEGSVGIPKELSFLQAQLREDEFAVYNSFHLIEQKALGIQRGTISEVGFRSGNRIGLSLLGNDDRRLEIHVELTSRDGKKNLLAADLGFNDGSVVMVRTGTFEHTGISGKLFFAIQCMRSG